MSAQVRCTHIGDDFALEIVRRAAASEVTSYWRSSFGQNVTVDASRVATATFWFAGDHLVTFGNQVRPNVTF